MKQKKSHRILTIGGGSGQFALLSGLRDMGGFEITAVVSMVDSGGSTGRLRDELGILPPGDILKCVLALSPHREVAREILLKRFKGDRRLMGHNAGNMLLTMLSRYTGSFATGVRALAEILGSKGSILPVTVDKATLVAQLTDGSRIYGEKAIDLPRGDQREKIRDVFLVPHHAESITVYPPVIEAITHADYILIGPGDLFTSIIPNFIVPDVKEAIGKTPAKIYYIENIMTKFGETHKFTGEDFVRTVEEFIDRRVNGVIYNTEKPADDILEKYRLQKSQFVVIDENDQWWGHRKRFASKMIDTTGGIVRHDSAKLAAEIKKIVGLSG